MSVLSLIYIVMGYNANKMFSKSTLLLLLLFFKYLPNQRFTPSINQDKVKLVKCSTKMKCESEIPIITDSH